MNQFEKQNNQILQKIKEGKKIPLLKIIRLKCLECTCWQSNEVKLCQISDCILYSFRFGKNPVPRKVSKEQIEAFRKRMKQRPR